MACDKSCSSCAFCRHQISAGGGEIVTLKKGGLTVWLREIERCVSRLVDVVLCDDDDEENDDEDRITSASSYKVDGASACLKCAEIVDKTQRLQQELVLCLRVLAGITSGSNLVHTSGSNLVHTSGSNLVHTSGSNVVHACRNVGVTDTDLMTRVNDDVDPGDQQVTARLNVTCPTDPGISKTDEEQKSSVVSCRHCRRVFYDYGAFVRHKCRQKAAAEKSRRKTNNFFCSQCNRHFTLKSNLSRHIRNTHSDRKDGDDSGEVQCHICQRVLRSHCHLRRHLRTVHEKAGTRWRCDRCGRCFKRGDHLAAHVAALHHNFRPHVCDTCARTFTRADSLADHVRLHTDERPHVCATCSRQFRERRGYMRHIRLGCSSNMITERDEENEPDTDSVNKQINDRTCSLTVARDRRQIAATNNDCVQLSDVCISDQPGFHGNCSSSATSADTANDDDDVIHSNNQLTVIFHDEIS